MFRSTTLRTSVVGIAALAVIGGLAVSASASAPSAPVSDEARKAPKESSLTGSAKMFRADGQQVRFSFDAHGFAPAEPDEPGAPAGTSRGTFRFSHYTADGTQGAYAEGRVDCLLTGGPVATATGVITRSDLPGAIGKRVGFTVYDGKGDGRKDRVGYSWAVGSIPTMEVPKCLSAAPYETVESGDFKVEHVLPPNPSGNSEKAANAGTEE
ncbi:hypothetical protein Slala03_32670 [Streptomyces lavendulae subsp. lavendulae]|uniref:hypothetical protein n=1 Tax=Streptomyces lavendulae TaxID=1914 RepID=UPI0024A46D9B|nr:hypothetical protein [Streptomyces lavendulae]GLV83578.1 hypothetical protein Slala03_32670 [Streptomyces lavendulae subsp. lavendulae]